MSVLEIRNLTVSAGDLPLVREVDLVITQGEIVALVGESGSGKTLTALSVMGLLPVGLRQAGEIRFEGQKVLLPGESGAGTPIQNLRGSRAGMIFQEPMTSLNPLHTIRKQVGEAISIHHRGMKESAVHARIVELLENVGLGEFRDRLDTYPHQLSGGERQRVMIAMAIANDPALLIADEPTTALDVTIQAQILALLKGLCARLHMSVLLITHDLTIVRRVADRVAIMSQGELVESGRTAEIFASPKHPYTQHLLASGPGKQPAPAPDKAPALVECRGLSVAFPTGQGLFTWKRRMKPVLEDVSFTVPEGTTLGIVGESGSGKTSLALALLRLIPGGGEIILSGHEGGDIRLDRLKGEALRHRRRDMQMVFQDPYSSLNPRMTVGAIIREGLDVHEPALTEGAREERVASILQEVGLSPEVAQRYPHEFSGGQRQRISIARALILKPRLLILDEPTSALDLSVQAQILELLKGLQEKYALTYIFISHDLRVIRAISHRILVLKNGRMIETGRAEDIFHAPKQDYTKALLKAAML